MAAVNLEQTWDVRLKSPEFLLVLKALGGRLKPEEVAEAEELGNALTAAKATTTKHVLTYNEKLLENLANPPIKFRRVRDIQG